jgi:hypothetical protein
MFIYYELLNNYLELSEYQALSIGCARKHYARQNMHLLVTFPKE